MTVEARVNPGWVRKWVAMGLVLIGLGLWSLYDGLVAYPEHNRKVEKFNELKAGNRLPEWRNVAENEGWSEDDPGEPKSAFDIGSQWVMVAICVPLGLAALFMVAVTTRRRIVAHDQGLRGPGGSEIPYGRITSIDRSRWESKGIAVVHYETEGGGKRSVKLDGWVFRGAATVLEEVEHQTGL